MGILSRLFGRKSTVTLEGDGTFSVSVAGAAHYKSSLKKACPKLRNGKERIMDALLVMESDNPHDRNAVAVKIAGLKVGYLPRDLAPVYRKQMRKLGHKSADAQCKAEVCLDDGDYTISLDINT